MNKTILIVFGLLAALLTAAGMMFISQSISEQIIIDSHDKGLAFYQQNEYDKAIAEFNKVIKFDRFGDVHNSMGLAYWGKEEYDKAIQYFSKSIKLNPKSSAAYFNRAQVYFILGKYALALADFDNRLKLGIDEEVIVAIWLGQCYFHVGEYHEAINHLNKALENIDHHNLNNRNYYFYRGSSYAKTGAYQKAIADFNSALTFDKCETTVSDEEIKHAIDQAKENK